MKLVRQLNPDDILSVSECQLVPFFVTMFLWSHRQKIVLSNVMLCASNADCVALLNFQDELQQNCFFGALMLGNDLCIKRIVIIIKPRSYLNFTSYFCAERESTRVCLLSIHFLFLNRDVRPALFYFVS